MSDFKSKFLKIDDHSTIDPLDSLESIIGNTTGIKFNSKTSRFLTERQ